MKTICVLMISEAYSLILEWTLFHTSSDGLYQDPTGEEHLIGACPFLPPQANQSKRYETASLVSLYSLDQSRM